MSFSYVARQRKQAAIRRAEERLRRSFADLRHSIQNQFVPEIEDRLDRAAERERVRLMKLCGCTPEQTAEACGLSLQRVAEILRSLNEEGPTDAR